MSVFNVDLQNHLNILKSKFHQIKSEKKMQKSKKQKYQQQLRKNLKMIVNLQPELVPFIKNQPYKSESLLTKTYPYIHGLQLLRTLTIIEINYILSTFLEIIQKSNSSSLKIQNVKVGIIGGGIMGRLILNTILVFTKQGLKSQNILISTRQPGHLQFYQDNFLVKTFFDNQKIAKQCDIIFVATSATLDNWIIVDLKKNIQKRSDHNNISMNQTTRTSYASTVNVSSGAQKQKEKTSHKPSELGNESILINKASKKIINPVKQQPIILRPFVYILTSDFTVQKSKKLFDFPVLSPFFRATDISKILESIKKHLQKANVQNLTNLQQIVKQLEIIMMQQLFQTQNIEANTESQNIQKINQNQKKSLNQKRSLETQKKMSRVQELIQTLSFSFKRLEMALKKQQMYSGDKAKIDYDSLKQTENNKLYTDSLQSQQGSYKQTFLTKCRRWRMAYNNFIA